MGSCLSILCCEPQDQCLFCRHHHGHHGTLQRPNINGKTGCAYKKNKPIYKEQKYEQIDYYQERQYYQTPSNHYSTNSVTKPTSFESYNGTIQTPTGYKTELITKQIPVYKTITESKIVGYEKGCGCHECRCKNCSNKK